MLRRPAKKVLAARVLMAGTCSRAALRSARKLFGSPDGAGYGELAGARQRVTNAATEATGMGGPVIISPGVRRRGSRPLLRTKIGERLRRTRRDQGRTLADVCRAARVSVPYLSEVERGRKEASSEVLAAICDALWIDLSDLLAGVARDLAADRAPGGTVIRLDSAGAGRRPAPLRPPGDAQCLLAA
jgi:transcriptional regulator with XRE-family HTH domain